MKTYVRLQQYPAEFFLEWEMCQTNVVEKIKAHFMFSNIFLKIMWKNLV
jgi:hypothetical protein